MAWMPNYCTTVELAQHERISDTVDDEQINTAIAAASRAVDRTCRRQFGSATTSRIYTPRFDAELLKTVVDTDDLASVTALATDTAADGTFATAVTTYTLRPRNAVADGFPYTQVAASAMPLVADSVRITGTFGWAAVPDAVRQATMLQASRILMRRDAPFGVAGSPEVGSEIRLLAKVDPDVEVALSLYVRRGWGFV